MQVGVLLVQQYGQYGGGSGSEGVADQNEVVRVGALVLEYRQKHKITQKKKTEQEGGECDRAMDTEVETDKSRQDETDFQKRDSQGESEKETQESEKRPRKRIREKGVGKRKRAGEMNRKETSCQTPWRKAEDTCTDRDRQRERERRGRNERHKDREGYPPGPCRTPGTAASRL